MASWMAFVIAMLGIVTTPLPLIIAGSALHSLGIRRGWWPGSTFLDADDPVENAVAWWFYLLVGSTWVGSWLWVGLISGVVAAAPFRSQLWNYLLCVSIPPTACAVLWFKARYIKPMLEHRLDSLMVRITLAYYRFRWRMIHADDIGFKAQPGLSEEVFDDYLDDDSLPADDSSAGETLSPISKQEVPVIGITTGYVYSGGIVPDKSISPLAPAPESEFVQLGGWLHGGQWR